MKTRKLLSPANNDAAATGDTTLAKKVNKKSKLPIKDNDFGNLCTKVGDKWKTLPSLTLMFITQGQFETKAVSFNTTLASRQKAGGDRTHLPRSLKTVMLQ